MKQNSEGWPLWGIILVGALIVYYLSLGARKLQIKWGMFNKNNIRIDGKIVIITGANSGIGLETAIDLAKRGGKIYIACRDIGKGQIALIKIIEKSGSSNVHLLQLDLASLSSIREFVKKFLEVEQSLHILINNAGVMACPKTLTEDGFEMQIGVNHLGHFLLTNLLLDTLKSSSPSRIVVVSAIAYRFGDINKEDFNSEVSYSKYKAYAQSKLANIMFTLELSRRLKDTGVTVNCLHPGIVDTEIIRHFKPNITKALRPACLSFLQTPNQGAQTQIKLAVDPDLNEVSGEYFEYCKRKIIPSKFLDSETHMWLWNKSEELTTFVA